MGLHHLKVAPMLFLWLQNCRISGGETTVQSTTIPGIPSTISSTTQTIIETDTSVDGAAGTVRKNTSTTIEDTSATHPSSYVQDTSTAVFTEKLITQNPGHFPSSPVETTHEMTVTTEMSTIRNSRLTSLPSTGSLTEITADLTNPVGTPDEKLLTSGTTTFTSILPLEATPFTNTLVNGASDDPATSVEIISPTTLPSDTQDKTTFTTEHLATLMHSVTASKTNGAADIGTDGTQSLPLSTISDVETAPAFSPFTGDTLTSIHSTMLPFETRASTHILENQDTAHTSEEVSTCTSAPFSSLSASSTAEMSSAFTTTMEPISWTASLSSTSPLERTATTRILGDWDTTSGKAATTEDTTLPTVTEVISASSHSTMPSYERTASTGILGNWDTTSEEPSTTEATTEAASTSSITTSNTVELPSTFQIRTEVISASSHSTVPSSESTSSTGILGNWDTTSREPSTTEATTEPATEAASTSSITTSNTVELPSTFQIRTEFISASSHSTVPSSESTSSTGILGNWDTTSGEPSTTEATTEPATEAASTSSITTSNTVELPSTFHIRTEVISASSHSTMPSPESTATTSFLADQATTGTSSEVCPSTMGDTTAAISSFNSSSVEIPSTFSPTAETTSTPFPSTTLPFETTATIGILADENTTGQSKNMTDTIGFLFTSSTVETQFTSRFSTDANTGFLSMVAPSKTTATSGIITDANTTHTSREETTNTKGDLTASISTIPAKQSSAALFSPAETAAEVSSTPAGTTIPVTQLSTLVSEASSAFSPTTEATTIALTEMAASTGRAATGRFRTINLEEVVSTLVEMATSTTVDESSPAQLFSRTPHKAATETGSSTTVELITFSQTVVAASATLSSFPQAKTTDETSSTRGTTSEATSTVFPPSKSPVEITTNASIATDSGTKSISTTEGRTTSGLPSANTTLGGRTVTAKLTTPSDTITSLSNSKPPAAHDLGRICFILSVSLTTSLNITDPAVGDAVVKKFHQDLHARFPDAGFSVSWLGQQQES